MVQKSVRGLSISLQERFLHPARSSIASVRCKAVFCETDGRGQAAGKRLFAVVPGEPVECRRFAGNARRSGTFERGLLFGLSVAVDEKIRPCPRRCRFASIDENVEVIAGPV